MARIDCSVRDCGDPEDEGGARVFEGMPDDLDESWRGGVLVGGMATVADDLEIARSYAEAASLLVSRAIADRDELRFLYPTLFLYRHALELYLKLVVDPKRLNHNLLPLIEQFDVFIFQRYGARIPKALLEDLLELAKIDPNGEAFRYSRDRNKMPRILPGENWVSLGELRHLMERFFHGVEEALRPASTPISASGC